MKVIIVFLGALLVTFLLLWSSSGLLNTFISKQISRLGENYLGVAVNTESVNVSLTKGEIKILGLTVANPSGFSEKTFVKVGDLQVHANLLSFLFDQIQIYKIRAKPIHLEVELQNGRFNYQYLFEHLEDKQRLKKSTITGNNSTSIINELLLEKITAHIRFSSNLKPLILEIQTVKLQNVDTSDGPSALLQILQQLLKSATPKESAGFLADTTKSILRHFLKSKSK